MKKIRFLVFSIFSISSLLLSSCSIFNNEKDQPNIEEPSEEIPGEEKPEEETPGEEKPEEDNGKIRIGLNLDFGSGAAYSAFNQGYFIEEGLSPDVVVTGESDFIEGLLSGEINVGVVGNRSSVNYFTKDSTIKMVAIDNLSNDERLISFNFGNGAGLTSNSTIEELGEALSGSSVVLDRGSQSYSFWNGLIDKINMQLPSDKDIWYLNSYGRKIPTNLEVYLDKNQINVIHMKNSLIYDAMQTEEYDFCVAFSNEASNLVKEKGMFTMIASPITHLKEFITPLTWAVNLEWLKTHEETMKKYMRALVRGMNFRRDDPEMCEIDIEYVTCGGYKRGFPFDSVYLLGAEEQLEIIHTGDAYQYVQNIWSSHFSSDDSEQISVDEVVDFSYLINACLELI